MYVFLTRDLQSCRLYVNIAHLIKTMLLCLHLLELNSFFLSVLLFLYLYSVWPPAENEEADHSQLRPENERETRRPQSLRRQWRKTEGRWQNLHHFRERDAFLTHGLTDQPSCLLSLKKTQQNKTQQHYRPATQNKISNKWLRWPFWFCKKKVLKNLEKSLIM